MLQKIFNYSLLLLGAFPTTAPVTAQHFREFVNKVLEEYKLVLNPTEFVVTDNEPKMLAAFREQCFRIGCADHYLNKQLQYAFQSEKIYYNKNTFETIDCELVQTVFAHVKSVVSFVRHSHQQQKLLARYRVIVKHVLLE